MTLPELRNLTARELIRALERDGFICRRIHGSHMVYAHADGRIIPIAFHGRGETFPSGTLRSILSATGWTGTDFVRLGLMRRKGSGTTSSSNRKNPLH